VLTRPVLAALAAGIAANDDDAARAALDRIDPVARGFAKRKLGRALIDAELVAEGKPAAHVMRVAALSLAGRSVPVDADRVEAAYAELPRVTMPRVPVWTIASVLIALLVAGGVAFAIATRPGPAARTYTRPMPPPSAQAFGKGGVPLHDPALDALLTKPLTKLVVDAARGPVKALVLPAAYASRRTLETAWARMMATFIEAARTPDQRADLNLREAARDVTAALHELGLGYVLEGRIHNGYAYLQAYSVTEVVILQVSGQPRRVLSLTRLDHLNTAYAVLGLHSDGLADPVLMDERIDEEVARDIIPVLAKDAPYPLADHAYLLSKEGKELAARVGQTVRAEYAAALGADASSAQKIATLLVERQDLIEQWRDALARRHLGMIATDELFLPDGLLGQLDGLVPHYQAERVEAIEDAIAGLDAPRIASRIHELVAATVRRHEAEHGYDFDRETDLRYPQALADMLGPPHDEAGNPVAIVRAARAELSAYLSQIANDPVTPHAAFWHLARQAFDKDRWYTGEMYAAYVVIEGLARHLAPELRPVGRGNERLAPLARAIAQAPGPKLREAASALWSELYGEPLTTITP
jgi:hypothetical protein